MTVITLSRQMGSLGDEIAVEVAQRLGLRLVDQEVINRAALESGVPRVALEELGYEGQRNVAQQVLKAMRAMPLIPTASHADREDASLPLPFGGLLSPTAPPISASIEQYVHMVGLVVRNLAREGEVLIAGRGGQILLAKEPKTLHLQIVAPEPIRREWVMARFKINYREASLRVRASDRARADYIRRYHNADWLDPCLYHLVINTGQIPVAVASEMIVGLHNALTGA
jgi:cytidylate kinase